MPRHDLAPAHVGDVTAGALVKSDQHTALLRDVPHGEPGAEAVLPGRTGDRPQHAVRPDAADVPQRVLEHPLLDGDLRVGRDVLHRAAAARTRVQPGVRAPGFNAQHRGAVDADDASGLVARLVLAALVDHALAGQRALDEDRLAFAMRDAAPLLIERFDLGGELVSCPGT